MSKTEHVKATFRFERETKGAVRFAEVDDKGNERTNDETGALIGTLYLRKKQLPNGAIPKMLKVDVEVVT